MSQFNPARFARGVKVTTDHVYDPLTDISNAAASVGIDGIANNIGTTRATWVLPWISAAGVERENSPVCVWPFTMPPFQQLFDSATKADPLYLVRLSELSLSFDTRAEPYGTTGSNAGISGSPAGQLTDCGMSRYDMTLRLCERTPYVVSGETSAFNEVMKIELSGETLWGGATRRANPLLLDGLNISIKPFSVYFWRIDCPGLFTLDDATYEQLSIVSLTLQAAFTSPLFPRDRVTDFDDPPGLQNIPTKHNGAYAPQTLAVTVPAVNATITGDDVQDQLHVFDKALREGAASGYGNGYGANQNTPLAADRYPEELTPNDSHYCMIAVPMWTGFGINAVLAADVPSGWLPYTTGAALWKDPAFDQRVMPVPDNFVLHHAFAVEGVYSPADTFLASHALSGLFSNAGTYVQEVGIIIASGWRSDEYRLQNAAYHTWQGNIAPNFDRFKVDLGYDCYNMHAIPIVSDAANAAHSWVAQGQPFFMGNANNSTETRSFTATVGGVTAYPATNGRENMLVVRWSKQDATFGLNDGAEPRATRAGQGGSWVILCGKITVGA